VYVKRGMII